MNVNPLITLVIPVRLSEDNLYDEVERIDRILETLPPDGFEALIVDYGSCAERRPELTDVGQRHSVTVIRVDSEDQVFSVGRARDIGTQHARTSLVLYHDIDFLMSRENYKRILLEARVRNMPENLHTFFILPGAYLTESFSQDYTSYFEHGQGELADHILHDAIMRLDHSVYSGMTYAISALVANRLHLLAVGGHDPQFEGHGAEDFELFHRLASYYQKGPRTRDYYKNTIGSNSIQTYTGFRAYFALYGIDVFQRGLILAHLYHPRRPDPSYAVTDNNSRVGEVMREYDTGASSLPPLPDLTVPETTLFLAGEHSAPWSALRQVIPLLGVTTFRDTSDFDSPDRFADFIKSGDFTQILFIRSDDESDLDGLYQQAKEQKCRTIIFGKGNVDNSWYFDRKGFSQNHPPEANSDQINSFGQLLEHAPGETGEKGPTGRIDFTTIQGVAPEPVVSDFTEVPISLHAPLFYSYGGVQVLANLQSAGPIKSPPAEICTPSLVHQGFHAYHSGNFHECVNLLTRAIEHSPTDPSLLRAIAEAHVSLGDRQAALEFLNRAKVLLPKNRNLKKRIRELRGNRWHCFLQKPTPFQIPLS